MSTIKNTLIISTLILLYGCSQEQGVNHVSKIESKSIKEIKNSKKYTVSTYDASKQTSQLINHKKTLNRLYEEKVFTAIDKQLKQNLSKQHQQYFKEKSEYVLLSVTKGHLFHDNSMDYAFTAYDKINQRVSIIIYDIYANTYSELYRDLKVDDSLDNANCYYGIF